MRIGIVWTILVFGTSLGLFACGAEEPPPSSTTTSGSGGSGGGEPKLPPARCGELCDHVSQIKCFVWPSCAKDCADYLRADEACESAFETLLGCWADQKADFTCLPTQVVPPAGCKAEEDAFRACAQGQTRSDTAACTGQSGTNASDACTSSTFCAGVGELRTSCTRLGDGTWQCTCRSDVSLLGTCTEPTGKCDNLEGCCSAFFF
ncbi:hypothetical protein [Polyangium fumosum]|uniref:Uncharacterized protein n=1 Tax=Polyangium fumosum TaxID=889272 RepID=A0A4U1IR55_9BACT|nr:hypothetical protein [Polyangium fumosum]TKC96348.1 hypothetical protein E8A74_45925 [Polyangium fumosum]